MSTSYKCPMCSHSKTRIRSTRQGNYRAPIYRRRECQGCGYRWGTYEIGRELYDKLFAPAQKPEHKPNVRRIADDDRIRRKEQKRARDRKRRRKRRINSLINRVEEAYSEGLSRHYSIGHILVDLSDLGYSEAIAADTLRITPKQLEEVMGHVCPDGSIQFKESA